MPWCTWFWQFQEYIRDGGLHGRVMVFSHTVVWGHPCSSKKCLTMFEYVSTILTISSLVRQSRQEESSLRSLIGENRREWMLVDVTQEKLTQYTTNS